MPLRKLSLILFVNHDSGAMKTHSGRAASGPVKVNNGFTLPADKSCGIEVSTLHLLQTLCSAQHKLWIGWGPTKAV